MAAMSCAAPWVTGIGSVFNILPWLGWSGGNEGPQGWEKAWFSLTSASLFQAAGLHFRHTDNINHWRNAMSHVGLPSVTSPLCFPQQRDTLAFALWQYWGVLVWPGGLCL